LEYRVEFENEGEGDAYGVYFTDILDEDLNDASLIISPVYSTTDGSIIGAPGTYNPATRTITWFVGEVGSKKGGYANISANVFPDAVDGTVVINYGTVYFPSVPEITRTNGIISIVGLNQPPAADAGGPYTGVEGSAVLFNSTGSSDPDGDLLKSRWDFNDDGVWDTEWCECNGKSHIWDNDWTGIVRIEVTDGEFTTADTALVTIANSAPKIMAVKGPADPIMVNTMIQANASFSDPGTKDTHEGLWLWGNGATSQGFVSEINGSGNITGSYAYPSPGIYELRLNVSDDDVGQDSLALPGSVMVYDPKAGFVTGLGSIQSPTGTYTANPSLTGPATIELLARYPVIMNKPFTGVTAFQFAKAKMAFTSTSYDWLVIQREAKKAFYRGSGRINGKGDYGFLVSVIDGGSKPAQDLFRIKIWDKATGNVIFDTQPGAEDIADPTMPLKTGRLVIDKL
jgi:hypothetical protein